MSYKYFNCNLPSIKREATNSYFIDSHTHLVEMSEFKYSHQDKKMKKGVKILIISLLISLITVSICFGENINKTIQVTYRNISILYDGKQINSEQEPFIYEGRVFAPIRTIGEALNKKVDWNNAKNQVIITDKINETNGLYLNIPVYKIGDRIAYEDFAITVNKRLNRNYDYPLFKKNGILVLNCTFEYLGDKKFGYVSDNDLAIYDQDGNRYVCYKDTMMTATLDRGERISGDFYFPIENSDHKKGLTLCFEPIFNRNIFIAISLEKGGIK